MKLSDYMTAIVNDLKTNASFLNDVGTHGKVFGLDEIRQLSLNAPACRIALVGSRGGSAALPRSFNTTGAMGRADTGQFRGPLQMIAFLIEQDLAGDEARDRAIKLADDFMTFLEHRQFGLSDTEAGPALITGFEIFYSAELDDQGASIAAVSWEQEVWFGRSLHDEDMALLTGDENYGYPSGQQFYPEKEWADKGNLDVHTPPLGKGKATGQFVHDTTVDPECPTNSPPDPDDQNYKTVDVEGE